ncbi:protein required for templated centriole assembly [Dunaliella salina]|uniref:Protein required for templated centriole assembly n=1 Tax=Dunaliella salina TaxID=3046 RepID=A0ABQ7H9E6_DUNSA|nr:protein required for templated centriole assembly [Dunaliella salina]|eukprot:KAF5843476.1 protein required for templated centriole assembly [Dunaliella salina]
MSSESSSTGGGADISETVEVSFHSIAYLLTVSTVNGDTLCLEVEQKSDASRWRGDFTARYIEDITAKTGNFKKFHVFVKMLLSAVKYASDSVFMDLLTYQDLEVLKSRKAAPAGGGTQNPHVPPPRNPTVAPNNKRYLILTYAAEFDRVHYPLPLLYEEHPDPQYLKSIISKLRSQVEELQHQQQQQLQHGVGARGARGVDAAATAAALPAELRRLREDNAVLKQQLRQLERGGQQGGGGLEAREMARDMKLVGGQMGLGCGVGRLSCHGPRPSVPSGARYGTRQDPPPRSRETSRGRDTSSRERERMPSQRYPPSRPSSAPSARSGPRFDPTEYIRAKRERDRMLLERARSSPGSSRNLTPQRSAASTPPRAYSPVSSRPPSAERGVGAYGTRGGAGGGYSPTSRGGYSPSSSRPTSGLDRGTAARPDRLRGGAGLASSPYADPLVLPKSRAGSPSSGGTGSKRPAWGSGKEAWSKFPEPGGRPKSRPESAERSTSPGRALQEVKNRLSSYMTSRSSAGVQMHCTLRSLQITLCNRAART